VDLNSIYFFIQGAIAAGNNCAEIEATKLYNQADKMLNNFIKNNCGCSGNNYVNKLLLIWQVVTNCGANVGCGM
jgi:hypothetical protein